MKQDILIYERSSREYVTAELHDDVSAEQLAEAESQWKPFREQSLDRLFSRGKPPKRIHALFQHFHWDWHKKAQMVLCTERPGVRCLGITLAGQWQGLAMLDLAGHTAELGEDKGQPLIYVEFLESAPWNLKAICDEPRYGLTGRRLMEAVVRQSVEMGFGGRVGLFSLPQAELFYERCGMTHVAGETQLGMKWYEMTERGAIHLLEDSGE